MNKKLREKPISKELQVLQKYVADLEKANAGGEMNESAQHYEILCEHVNLRDDIVGRRGYY